jgi:hypothetical protein
LGGADFAAVGGVLLVTLLMAAELMQPGIQNYRDALMSVYRVFELDQAWGQGTLYPRIGPDLNFRLGAPLFQFYPPLAAYGGLLLHGLGLGFVAATKGTMAISLLLGGLGVYTYVRRLTGRSLGAATAAVLFLFAPYVLLTTYERGAAAEALALGLLPWLLWALHRLLDDAPREEGQRQDGQQQHAQHVNGLHEDEQHKAEQHEDGQRREGRRSAGGAGANEGPAGPVGVLVAAILVAGMMLAHNITALVVLPAALVYVGILAAARRDAAALGRIGAACGLGLGLSAFYWVPALAELRYTRAETMMLQGVTDVTAGLVAAADLVQASWTAIYSGDARFQVGRLVFVYGLLAIGSVPCQDKGRRLAAGLLAGAIAGVLLLQLDVAQGFWEHMPLVRFVQFPWRLYGVAAFCTAVLIGLLLDSARMRGLPAWVRPLAAVLLVLGAGAANVPNARAGALPLWTEMREAKIAIPNLFELGRLEFPLFTDYTPAAMEIYGAAIAQPRPAAEAADEAADEIAAADDIRIERVVQNGFDLSVTAPAAWTLKAPRAYFPGWQVRVDGEAVPTGPSGPLGLVTAAVPAGAHQVSIRFEQTPLRMAADLLSLMSLAVALALLLGGLVFAAPQRWRRWALAGGVLLAAGTLLLTTRVREAAAVQPPAQGTTLGDEVTLLAYQVDDAVVRPGEKLAVKLYWYVQRSPHGERKVFLHVNRPDDSGRIAQNDQAPLLGYYPASQWEDGQIFMDEYRIEIPPDAPPGRYVLTGGMYRPDPLENLPASGPNTWPGDRLLLGEVEVQP